MVGKVWRARVVALEGPRRAWEVSGGDGHRVLDGRLHVVERAGGGIRRRTFDAFGREVWRRWWRVAGPPPGVKCRLGAMPLGSGGVVVVDGCYPPRVRVGDPDGGWHTVALPDDGISPFVSLIPLRDGGVLVSGEAPVVVTALLGVESRAYTVPIDPDGRVGPTRVTRGASALTARIELGWGEVDIHDFSDPWEPGWDVVMHPRRGVRRRAGWLGLEAAGTLFHDGWLFVQDAAGPLYAVQIGELRRRDALALGLLAPLSDLFGLRLAPGAEAARRRLRATVPGPFDGWRIIPGTTWSVRPFEGEPRAVRWTRLDDAGHGLWLFAGPGAPRQGAELVIDPSGDVRVSGWVKHLMAGSPDLYSPPAAARMGDPRRQRLPEETPCARSARSAPPSPPPCSRASA